MKPYRLELENDLHKQIKVTASKEEKSMKDFIIEAIQEKMNKNQEE